MEEDHYMSAQQALELRIVDGVGEKGHFYKFSSDAKPPDVYYAKPPEPASEATAAAAPTAGAGGAPARPSE